MYKHVQTFPATAGSVPMQFLVQQTIALWYGLSSKVASRQQGVKSKSITLVPFPPTFRCPDLRIEPSSYGFLPELIEQLCFLLNLPGKTLVLFAALHASVPHLGELLVESLFLFQGTQPVPQTIFALEAEPVPIAVAFVLGRAELEVAREYVLPRILHQPSRGLVVQLRRQ